MNSDKEISEHENQTQSSRERIRETTGPSRFIEQVEEVEKNSEES
jgi:hypothetical protein